MNLVKMAAPNRPQFFCTRPDGSLTPLLAVDELPPGLAVHGAPRVLNAGETQGMTSCGLAAPRTEPWPIEGVAHVFPTDMGKDALLEIQKLLVQIMSDLQVPSHIRMAVQGILYRAIDLPGSMNIDSTSNGTVMSPLAPIFSMNVHVGKGVSLNCLVEVAWRMWLTYACTGPPQQEGVLLLLDPSWGVRLCSAR